MTALKIFFNKETGGSPVIIIQNVHTRVNDQITSAKVYPVNKQPLELSSRENTPCRHTKQVLLQEMNGHVVLQARQRLLQSLSFQQGF